MTVTVQSFRETFPALSDQSLYDGNTITFYLNLAVNCFQNALRWDVNSIDYGTCLFIAHNLVLDARANATARVPGGIPGTLQGLITAKSVDKVSASYDVEAVMEKDGSWWNMTSYGVRFLQLLRLYGSGGQQLGGPCGGYPTGIGGGFGWGI